MGRAPWPPSPCTRISSSPAAAVRHPVGSPRCPPGDSAPHARRTRHQGLPPPPHPHPHRPLGQLFGGLNSSALGPWRPPEPASARHQGPCRCVGQATGMHQTLAGGGIAQPGALLHWQRIHVHPQTHRGAVSGPNSATTPVRPTPHEPANPADAVHRRPGRGLRPQRRAQGGHADAMQPQLRQLTTEPIGGTPLGSSQDASKARNAIRSAVGCGTAAYRPASRPGDR